MSGRAAGYCAGYAVPGYANQIPGRGLGRGAGRGYAAWGRGCFGGGRGWRNWYHATGLPGWMRYNYAAPAADPGLEKQALQNQVEILESQLDLVKKRISELEKAPEKE